MAVKRQIIVDGKTYEVEYEASENHIQSVVLPTPAIPGSPAEGSVDEAKVCRSPVAGIVTRINVEPGNVVQPGQVVLVVEAMKMENNLSAPAAARVKVVHVRVGETVKPNQIVMEFE